MTCNGDVCTCLFDAVEKKHLKEARADERSLIMEMLSNAVKSGDFADHTDGLNSAITLVRLFGKVRP